MYVGNLAFLQAVVFQCLPYVLTESSLLRSYLLDGPKMFSFRFKLGSFTGPPSCGTPQISLLYTPCNLIMNSTIIIMTVGIL